jgi:type VI secretion system protein ImpE
MTGQDLWKEGRLDDAIAAQTAWVKAHPTEAEGRYLLFAFLCYTGDLDRADRQLDALGIQDPKLEAGSMVYRNLLASEAERRRVWRKGDEPLLPPDPPPWTKHRLEAIRAAREGEPGAVAAALEAARSAEGEVAGRCDDTAFSAILDTDDFLEPVLEVFAGGRYLWLPFERIRSLEIDDPKHVLDLLWIPAKLEDAEGTTADIHLPALYPDSHDSSGDGLRLGRATEWTETAGASRGEGQKILFLAAGDGDEDAERPLLSIRRLTLGAGADEPAADG